MEQVLIAFGSNLGDRAAALTAALRSLSQVPGLRLVACSSLYETEPVSPLPQGPYLNACALFEASMPPQLVLAHLQGLEARHGRTRSQPGAARTLDLDLLIHGERCLSNATLAVPHPRLHERAFVLIPAVDVAPDLVHPQLGRTMQQLLADLVDTDGVRPFAPWQLAVAAD